MSNGLINSSYPHFLHGGDYNPDQWLHLPEVIDEDFRLMELSGCNNFSVGIFAWSKLEPQEGQFQFEWLDDIMDRLAKSGRRCFLATPSGAKPAWMAQKYPEIRRVNIDGVRDRQQTRHNHCYSSPVYREKIALINSKLAERYHNHEALLGWHVSNEYNGCCYCDYCLAEYHKFLQKRYGTLEKLNHSWWCNFWSHNFTAWEEIPPFDGSIECSVVDWKRFVTDRTVDFYKHEVAAIRKYSDAPSMINMMGYFEGLDYHKFVPHLDIIADDAYPQFCNNGELPERAQYVAFVHDMHRAMKKKPWVLMESCPSSTNWQPVSKLKAPGIHKLEMLQSVALGADGVMYFQWRKSRGSSEKFHGAVVDHARPEQTRVFKEVSEVGEMLPKLEGLLGKIVSPEVAMVHDWENRWALQASSGPNNHADASKGYMKACQQHHRYFWEAGIPIDVIDTDADFSQYRLLLLPMLYMIPDELGAKIKAFIESGGIVVATYLSGLVNEHCLVHRGGWPGAGLMSTFGIWVEETDALWDTDKQTLVVNESNSLNLEGSYAANTYCDIIEAEGAEVIATYGSDFYHGSPAVTCNESGEGAAYYVGARTDYEFLREFYATLCRKHDIVISWPGEIPEAVSIQQRTDDENATFFVMNLAADPITVDCGVDMIDVVTDEPVGCSLDLKAFDVRVVRIGVQ